MSQRQPCTDRLAVPARRTHRRVGQQFDAEIRSPERGSIERAEERLEPHDTHGPRPIPQQSAVSEASPGGEEAGVEECSLEVAGGGRRGQCVRNEEAHRAQMFISVPRPREDAALSWTDAGFFATAAATTATFTDWEQPWNLDEFAAAQLLYGQRLREMASASQPQPSGWARLKPKRQSKKHQQQRRPHQSRQHTQQQECTVTEDPFHALQLGGAGLGGNFLVCLMSINPSFFFVYTEPNHAGGRLRTDRA